MLNKPISFSLKQQGFSLIEVLISLIISSIVFLAIITLYPLLTQQINRLYQTYHLDMMARQFLLMLEKDARRSGYCFGDCVGVALKISEKEGEAEHSCIHLIYDYNLDGKWEKAKDETSDFFIYRMHQGRLQIHRSREDCEGQGWINLFDPNQIVVSQFALTKVTMGEKRFLTVFLSLFPRAYPDLLREYKLKIYLRNQSI
ncbi:prepilin peptidase-dependent protein [Arsenophonus nasoniae]|uniref:Prepilin peptidase-dependent protein n=1 Tax=Arsenophonus nasoniae TaxID=638 RepID=A0AA95GAC9_9GAMM|nr:prepilin peptidase-dependent protein [Arsenophonus nasoniae]WGL94947.1 prepilin peptidase-dependent protein [Arsenophonus nasoniae]WGM02004.1 prepilin peptidase-dependent protein [Arsenophonus nasoniae]